MLSIELKGRVLYQTTYQQKEEDIATHEQEPQCSLTMFGN